MDLLTIQQRQDEALHAYDTLADLQVAYRALQAAMLAEIALRLNTLNSALANISENVEFLNRTRDFT